LVIFRVAEDTGSGDVMVDWGGTPYDWEADFAYWRSSWWLLLLKYLSLVERKSSEDSSVSCWDISVYDFGFDFFSLLSLSFFWVGCSRAELFLFLTSDAM
jgi:hypothetical protein